MSEIGFVGQATPLGAHALALYRAFVAEGGGETDFSGIIEHLEHAVREAASDGADPSATAPG